MEKKYSIFVPCDTAQHTCDKSQYNEASLIEKIKLSIHLVYCKACQTYTKKNNNLSKLMKDKKVQTMKSDEKDSLEALFKKELSKNK